MLNGTRVQKIRALSYDLERIMNSFGYTIVEIPVIENADLFLTKAGDQVIEKLFTFERYGQQLALRPEFTAAAAYHYANSGNNAVVRWQFHGAIFEEYTNNDISEYQRYSIGAELIGTNSLAADIEVMALALQGIISQNITGWTLRIGHAGVLREALAQFDLDTRTERFILNHRHLLTEAHIDEFRELLDRYLPQIANNNIPRSDENLLTQTLLATLGNGQLNNTLGGRTREDIATRILRKNQQVNERDKINGVIDLISAWSDIEDTPESAFQLLSNLLPNSKLLSQWEETVTLLASYDIPLEQIVIQPDLVRNWDYYTGIVFEIVDADGISLCGGGRYDELIGLIGDCNSVPAVGFAYDAIRLSEVVSNDLQRVDGYYLRSPKPDSTETWKWLLALRARHLPVTLAMPDQVNDDKSTFTVDHSGRLIFKQNSYTFDEIEKLIAETATNA